jgi:hypothetical protein
MTSDYTEFLRRLVFFIDTCYNGKSSKFASACGLPDSSITRMNSGSDIYVERTLFKMERAGLNRAWLIESGYPSIPMFAKNEIGKVLRQKYGDIVLPDKYDSAKKGRVMIFKIHDWIETNYISVEKFVEKHASKYNYSTEFLLSILNFSEMPDNFFMDMLEEAGCTREYLRSEFKKPVLEDGDPDAIENKVRKVLKELLPGAIEKAAENILKKSN